MRACPQERELKAVLDAGHWPHACSAELVAHVEGCRDCRTTTLLTTAFRREHGAAMARAQVQPAGIVWWRAQLRRRNAVVAGVVRPLAVAQIVTIALSLLAAVVVGARFGLGTNFADSMGRIARAFHFEALLPGAMQTPLGIGATLLAAVALTAAMAGALAYATSDRN